MHPDDLKDIFEPYDRLIEITVRGRRYAVPENNSLLRCLQYIDIESISNADLCWNGECLNCRVTIVAGGKERSVIACRTNAEDGMIVTHLSPQIPFEER